MSGAESEGEQRAAAAPRSPLSAAAALAVLLLLLGVVAAASGGGIGVRVGQTREPSQVFVDYAYTVAIVLAVAIVAVFALLVRGARGGLGASTAISRRRAWVVWALFALLAFGGYKAIRGADIERPEDEEPMITVPTWNAPSAQPRAREERPEPQFRWGVALVVAGAVALAAFAYLRRRQPPEAEPGPDDAAAAVSAVLDEALDDLRAERDARRAVIAAYARLEATLAYHGLPRRAAEAPLEYLSRILLELEVTPEAVLDLTELFEQAKFSRRRIDEAMKDEAIDALAAVRDDLRAAA